MHDPSIGPALCRIEAVLERLEAAVAHNHRLLHMLGEAIGDPYAMERLKHKLKESAASLEAAIEKDTHHVEPHSGRPCSAG